MTTAPLPATPPAASGAFRTPEAGFSLVETLVALLILLVAMAGVMSGMLQFSRTQSTVWNRANMHGSVRSATELLQQEVGQAGRVSLPSTVTMSTTISAPTTATVTVSSTAGMFPGEQLVIDAGDHEETVVVSAVNSPTSFTATFALPHAPSGGDNPPVTVRGGFANGVVPCATQASCPGSTVTTSYTDGSTGSVLKLFGDINGDGSMVYVEYVCDTDVGNLYRNMMPFDAASKPLVSASQVLLSNILPNPGGTACFTYEQRTVNHITYVVNVAISLTTRTQLRDQVTRQFQTETKALLNVAPRNVFDVWQLASIGAANRVQTIPDKTRLLLH